LKKKNLRVLKNTKVFKVQLDGMNSES